MKKMIKKFHIDYKKEFEKRKSWGLLTSVDIYDCDSEIIQNADKIKQYVIELCKLIEMKRFGETTVVHFGEDEKVAGYSMVQLIETSLISGHFANQTNSAYIDIFSCKYYDPEIMAQFTCDYFKGKSFVKSVTLRQ